MHPHPSLVAAVLALSASAQTWADPVTVDFSIVSTQGTAPHYAVGTVGQGSFTFDSSLVPLGGSGRAGNPMQGLPTLALDFEWFGAAFDEASASIVTLNFTDGQLVGWTLGGRYVPPICGLMRYTCLHSAGTQPDFMLSTADGGSLNDGVHAGIGSGYGTLAWQVAPAPVPEPPALALLGLGMAALVARRSLGRQLHGKAAQAGCQGLSSSGRWRT